MNERMPEKEFIGQNPLEEEITTLGKEIHKLADEAFYARGRGEIESAAALEQKKEELLAKQRELLAERADVKKKYSL